MTKLAYPDKYVGWDETVSWDEPGNMRDTWQIGQYIAFWGIGDEPSKTHYAGISGINVENRTLRVEWEDDDEFVRIDWIPTYNAEPAN